MKGCLGVLAAIGAIFIVAVAAVMISSDERAKNVASGQDSPIESITVTAPELNAAYESNEVAADNQYKGKLLYVCGVIKSIDKNAFEEIEIHLDDEMGFGSGTLTGVSATMINNPDTESVAPRLVRGQVLAVACPKIQRILGSVMLSDCSIDFDAMRAKTSKPVPAASDSGTDSNEQPAAPSGTVQSPATSPEVQQVPDAPVSNGERQPAPIERRPPDNAPK